VSRRFLLAAVALCTSVAGCANEDRVGGARENGTGDALAPASCRGTLTADNPVRLHKGVRALAAGDGALFAANPRAGTVTRVNTESGGAARPYRAGRTPVSLTLAGDQLWAADRDGDVALRLDPGTGRVEQRIDVETPMAIGFAGGELSVMSLDDGAVYFFDQSGRKLADIQLPVIAPSHMQQLGGDMWVLGAGDMSIFVANTRFKRAGGSGARIIGTAATDLAAGAGALWVADPVDRAVLRIEPSRLSMTVYQAPRPLAPAHVVVSDCGVWAADSKGRIGLFDPEALRWTGGPLEVGRSSGDLTADGAAVWVSDPVAGSVRRVAPAAP